MKIPQAHTAAELSALLAAGEVTSLELTRYYLARIAELNPTLNAVIAVAESSALAAASASDARRAQGTPASRLDGVPILIKDNIQAVGLPCTAGSRALLDSPVEVDAEVTTRLRSAGLVLLGSTNLSEWANFRSTSSTSGWSGVGGQTRNPYDVTRNTSGSSSGSAAAVAAALAPLTVGSETDGSIVSPAGVCGVVGFKPSRGTVPGAGIVPLSSVQDIAGPITRSVDDAVALFEILSARTLKLPETRLRDLAVGVWRPSGADERVLAVLDRLVELLRAQGVLLTDVEITGGGPFEAAEFDALVAEFAVDLPSYLAARPGRHPKTIAGLLEFDRADDIELSKFGDEIFELATHAPALDSEQYLQARRQADQSAAEGLATLLDGRQLGITLSNAPAWTTRHQLVDGSADEEHLSTSSLAAVTGAPSLSLPAGYVDGLPVGVSVIAAPGEDEVLLSFALALQELLPHRIEPELV
ncbi:amidase family protein [soil metagenome]